MHRPGVNGAAPKASQGVDAGARPPGSVWHRVGVREPASSVAHGSVVRAVGGPFITESGPTRIPNGALWQQHGPVPCTAIPSRVGPSTRPEETTDAHVDADQGSRNTQLIGRYKNCMDLTNLEPHKRLYRP